MGKQIQDIPYRKNDPYREANRIVMATHDGKIEIVNEGDTVVIDHYNRETGERYRGIRLKMDDFLDSLGLKMED